MKSVFCDPYDFETAYDLKSIELHCADLTDFMKQEIDVLVISAFKRDYMPAKGTVIGSLFNNGIDIKKLSEHPEIDLRESQDIWLSQEIDFTRYHIHRIACVELLQHDNVIKSYDTISHAVVGFDPEYKNLRKFLVHREAQAKIHQNFQPFPPARPRFRSV